MFAQVSWPLTPSSLRIADALPAFHRTQARWLTLQPGWSRRFVLLCAHWAPRSSCKDANVRRFQVLQRGGRVDFLWSEEVLPGAEKRVCQGGLWDSLSHRVQHSQVQRYYFENLAVHKWEEDWVLDSIYPRVQAAAEALGRRFWSIFLKRVEHTWARVHKDGGHGRLPVHRAQRCLQDPLSFDIGERAHRQQYPRKRQTMLRPRPSWARSNLRVPKCFERQT